MLKKYIKVTATFDCDGSLVPDYLFWDDNRRYKIDRITDVRYASSALSSGAGLRKLAEMIAAQGGDPRVVEDLSLLPQAAVKRVMRAETAGYLSAMDTTALGMAAQRMGAGRAKKSDMLDYSVGYVLHVRLGDEVTEDTPLATLYARNEAEAEEPDPALLDCPS